MLKAKVLEDIVECNIIWFLKGEEVVIFDRSATGSEVCIRRPDDMKSHRWVSVDKLELSSQANLSKIYGGYDGQPEHSQVAR